MELLKKVARRWHEFGRLAGLGQAELISLQSESTLSPEECLSQVIQKWVDKGQLDWEKVVTVLKGMGEEELASQVATEKGECCFGGLVAS